jgi:hypothetical protein
MLPLHARKSAAASSSSKRQSERKTDDSEEEGETHQPPRQKQSTAKATSSSAASSSSASSKKLTKGDLILLLNDKANYPSYAKLLQAANEGKKIAVEEEDAAAETVTPEAPDPTIPLQELRKNLLTRALEISKSIEENAKLRQATLEKLAAENKNLQSLRKDTTSDSSEAQNQLQANIAILSDEIDAITIKKEELELEASENTKASASNDDQLRALAPKKNAKRVDYKEEEESGDDDNDDDDFELDDDFAEAQQVNAERQAEEDIRKQDQVARFTHFVKALRVTADDYDDDDAYFHDALVSRQRKAFNDEEPYLAEELERHIKAEKRRLSEDYGIQLNNSAPNYNNNNNKKSGNKANETAAQRREDNKRELVSHNQQKTFSVSAVTALRNHAHVLPGETAH